MSRVYDKPITIEKIDNTSEEWAAVWKLHARLNKSKTDDEYLSGGATQGKRNIVFEVRYFSGLEDIANNIQRYRILYQGIPYDIGDYDDFMFKHKTVKLLGVSY